MSIGGDGQRDLSRLVVPLRGSLELTGDAFEPCRLADAAGMVVGPAAAYLREVGASGRAAATQRSYAYDLLRWFRFLWAVKVPWDEATRAEARDFLCWVQLADKPSRSHWRYPGGGAPGRGGSRQVPGSPNPVTGKPSRGRGYAAATVAHCETVLRSFYDFHLEAGTGPMVNPLPLARGRRGRPYAHHNPMEPFAGQRAGRYRPKAARRVPRQIPDERFDELFAQLGSHRDRALVAFWVSTGARASELLGATAGDADPGTQLITVIRKGTRALQQLPASPDAFVWLRLYQAQMEGLVPAGGTSRCGGRCAGRSARFLMTRPGRCSPGPARRWARTGRFMICVIRLPTSSDAGANLRELMERMGHSSSRAALIYLHSTSDRQHQIAETVAVRLQSELGKSDKTAANRVARVWHDGESTDGETP